MSNFIVKQSFLILFLSASLAVFSQNNQQYIEYIDKYKNLALKEQYNHGIPASITMAQAIIESNAGGSMLAVKANNHFGIKCGGNWAGKSVKKDDDNIQECFRKYRHVLESYEDHSLFLKRPRYRSLFEIPITNYKAWAKGLEKAGYATDPTYSRKLIKLIEDYNLHELDYQNQGDVDNFYAEPKTARRKSSTDNRSRSREQLSHDDYSSLLTKTVNNGKNCFRLKKDATIAEIAQALNKSNTKMLLYYNDLFEDRTLKAGTFVYTSTKKSKSNDNFRSYTIKDGDSMHSIAQQFGITLKALYKINNLPYGTPAAEGMTLFLK